jgi:hypothetical protein
MLTNLEPKSVIFPLLLFPLVCYATDTRQCRTDLDYPSHYLLMQAARRNHTATPIYGLDPSRPVSDIQGFDSEIDAVYAATNIYNPLSIDKDKEYLGAILERDGRFYYTVDAGGRAEDTVEIRIRIPTWYSIVAFWHTHGAPAYKRLFFSATDQRLVSYYNKPFYLADYTGSLKVLLPDAGISKLETAINTVPRSRNGFLQGKLVRSENGEVLNICTDRNV